MENRFEFVKGLGKVLKIEEIPDGESFLVHFEEWRDARDFLEFLICVWPWA